MSRIAALYDIHGNLPALEAVLSELEALGVEGIVAGGDMALGPMPRETLDLLLAQGSRVHWLRGNCDRLMVEAFDGDPLHHLSVGLREPIQWAAQQLDRSHRDILASLPLTQTLTVPSLGEVLFCHATPRDDDEIFTALSPPERVRPMFEGVGQRYVVCGHTHMAFQRELDGIQVINAGSVGMPFGQPGAYWLLLGPEVQPKRTTYDLQGAAARVRETSYPDLESFLDPPTAEQALELLETHPSD